MLTTKDSDDDVHEPLGHDDDFDDLSAVELLRHFFVGLGQPADFVFCHVDPHTIAAGMLKSAGN